MPFIGLKSLLNSISRIILIEVFDYNPNILNNNYQLKEFKKP